MVNTCAVTEHAEKKMPQPDSAASPRSAAAIIIAVTGCYAQLRPEELAAIKGVDLVLGNRDKGNAFRPGGRSRRQVGRPHLFIRHG